MSVWLPASIALATATTMPLSLNDPVGLRPSNLKYRSRKPNSGPMLTEGIRGVPPSLKLILGVRSVSGSLLAYRSITPPLSSPISRPPGLARTGRAITAPARRCGHGGHTPTARSRFEPYGEHAPPRDG